MPHSRDGGNGNLHARAGRAPGCYAVPGLEYLQLAALLLWIKNGHGVQVEDALYARDTDVSTCIEFSETPKLAAGMCHDYQCNY
eukprot:467315-Pelagomonas_calceolata.AAC.1